MQFQVDEVQLSCTHEMFYEEHHKCADEMIKNIYNYSK